MNRVSATRFRLTKAIALGLAALTTGFLASACQESAPPAATEGGTASPGASPASSSTAGLKIGSLLPATGDLASVGQAMLASVPMLVETVNQCGGVNGAPVSLVSVDDQTDPTAGSEGMTKLAEVDKVAGVVGSFASSVSTAALPIAIRNKVMLVSPGSTSPVFTDRAKKGEFQGYWARTAPPDTYQAQALATLANERGLKRVATIVINNDYGVGFERQFVEAFKKLGGTVTNEAKPTRYDPKATTFETEAQAAFSGKPDGVVAVAYAETGALLLKTAYQQGLSKGVQVLLTDGSKSDQFPEQVGKSGDGKYILTGAIGTIPGADGKALETLTKLWQAKFNKPPAEYAAQGWDAAALLVLAAQAAKSNTGEAIKGKILDVANGPGKDVSDVCEGLKLLQNGEDINYQGASGNVDIDENGDVSGVYDVWQVEDSGKLKTVSKVNPK
ncbi:ABC transporter substrate-binding protein [Leptolyngbya sp. FACHB-36]|uniref:ABC transporter substrate-binding protein n=1 Tax=Leptolyngbya sp. FACHB-36 TaxID=2692808 RepID=UPI0016814D67|nr:ABC transporter substrate-binding protein [Leptolyngbya sp. FACHB-36]MBD2021940.1 ABC transporter substrate-binding protein [Leptolyngbya sp. FACHB-36]